jgi:RHS repeat-associated protein
MPGRTYRATTSYRYGFNGKENDNEAKGVEGSQQDYGMRIYDPRISAWLSVDVLFSKFADVSPYCFALNSPVNLVDNDGRAPSPPRSRPTIDQLWNAYYGSHSSGEDIFDKLPSLRKSLEGQNTCAVRMSYCLYTANHKLPPRPQLLKLDKGTASADDQNTFKKKAWETKEIGSVVITAKMMGEYLASDEGYGKPDIDLEITTSNFEEVYNKVKDLQGIMVIVSGDGSNWKTRGITGHVDLLATINGTPTMRGDDNPGDPDYDDLKDFIEGAASPDNKKVKGRFMIWKLDGTLTSPPTTPPVNKTDSTSGSGSSQPPPSP